MEIFAMDESIKCPNPMCSGNIVQFTSNFYLGVCKKCGLFSKKCVDSKKNCSSWNLGVDRFCRSCGSLLKSKKFKLFSDKPEDINLRSLTKLFELGELNKFYRPEQFHFSLHECGNFIYLLGQDGRMIFLSIIDQKIYPIQFCHDKNLSGWRSISESSYILAYNKNKIFVFDVYQFDSLSSAPPRIEPKNSCRWESNDFSIVPNLKPLIWDINAQYTLLAWCASKQGGSLCLFLRKIKEDGAFFEDFIFPIENSTCDFFIDWEKMTSDPLKVFVLNNQKVMILDFNDFIKTDKDFKPTFKIVLERKDIYLDSFVKEWNHDLMLRPFLKFEETEEIIFATEDQEEPFRKYCFGFDGENSQVSSYRENAPGNPICIKDKNGFFSFDKGAVTYCSVARTSKPIGDVNQADIACLGALFDGNFLFYWGKFHDGKKDLYQLNIASLTKKINCLNGAYISNCLITPYGTIFLTKNDDNNLCVYSF